MQLGHCLKCECFLLALCAFASHLSSLDLTILAANMRSLAALPGLFWAVTAPLRYVTLPRDFWRCLLKLRSYDIDVLIDTPDIQSVRQRLLDAHNSAFANTTYNLYYVKVYVIALVARSIL